MKPGTSSSTTTQGNYMVANVMKALLASAAVGLGSSLVLVSAVFLLNI